MSGSPNAFRTSPTRAATLTKPTPESFPNPAGLPRVSASGVYRRHGRIAWGVVGTYIALILILAFVLPSSGIRESWAIDVILFLFVFFLLRYLSTSYSIDDTHLRAWRIFGSRRVPLEDVQKIEYSSIHDLGPTGFFGSWGWRGRMWSSSIGPFDAIYTDPAHGILVTAQGVPLYISPSHMEEFARELSRRVRSYTGRLQVDVGDPLAGISVSDRGATGT